MRIMFIIRSLANAHGVERTFIDKANYLAEHGHDVLMVTYEQGLHGYAYPVSSYVKRIDLDCRYFTIFDYSIPRRLLEANKIKNRFKKRIRILTEETLPDVVVASTYEGEFMNEIVGLKDKTRVILESHTAFVAHLNGNNLIEKVRKHFVLNKIKCCDLLIALTRQDANYWKQYVKNVIVVVNPLPDYIEELKQEEKVVGRIMAAGSLQHIKRFDRLIDAFSLIADQYPQWHVVIYGDGPEKQELKKKIFQYGLEGRFFLKGLTHNIYSEYLRSQFFVLSSDNEGFGLVIIEAMSCGLPVVSTDCPFGPREIIADGKTGLLSRLDAEDLAAKMEWMITHEKERMEMGENAHKSASRYKMDNVMKEWEAAYLSVI